MIGQHDIVNWAESIYDDFLRALIDGRDFFQPPPRRERLGRVPAARDPNAFAAAVSPLWEGSKQVRGVGYSVILESHQRRSRGLQNEPVAVEIQTEADYVALVGKASELRKFREDAAFVLERLPLVRDLLRSRPRLLTENQGVWAGIVEIVEHLRIHPRPGCFPRALPVSSHTKFIETHQAVIEAMLSVHPECGYDVQGLSFEDRCGFRHDEPSVRGRFLCPRLQQACGYPTADLDLRVSAWASLGLPPEARVIACENKANFLALPCMEHTLALWGAGGAATGLFAKLPWLATRPFLYWGDLDPCGFAILAALRGFLPNTRSALMDAATLAAHKDALGHAKSPPQGIRWERLTDVEIAAAKAIESPPRGIEQEKLLFRDCLQVITAAFD